MLQPGCSWHAGLKWNWAYEAIATGFMSAADMCALHIQAIPPNLGTDATHDMAAGGVTVWEAVLQAWALYSAWLDRVISITRTLAECVVAERNAEMHSRGRFDTPTLYDVGKAAFRSQVLDAPSGLAEQRPLHPATALRWAFLSAAPAPAGIHAMM